MRFLASPCLFLISICHPPCGFECWLCPPPWGMQPNRGNLSSGSKKSSPLMPASPQTELALAHQFYSLKKSRWGTFLWWSERRVWSPHLSRWHSLWRYRRGIFFRIVFKVPTGNVDLSQTIYYCLWQPAGRLLPLLIERQACVYVCICVCVYVCVCAVGS